MLLTTSSAPAPLPGPAILRSGLRWGLANGLPTLAIRRRAQQGSPMARLVIDAELRADPFGTYEQMRDQTIHSDSLISGTVSHAAATEILRNDAFSVALELPGRLQRLHQRTIDPWAVGPVEPPSMLAVDPPVHSRYRRLVTRAFTAREITRLEGRVVETATRLLDSIQARGLREFDVVEEYAALLPVAIIADILGVPSSMHRQLLAWGNNAALTLDPALSWSQFRRAEKDLRALHRWLDGHLADKRRAPGDDLLSSLATLEDDSLTDLELRGVALLVLGAGFETTVNLLGNAIVQLDQHRDQRALLLADPTRYGNAVEEVLRYDSPVQLTFRAAKEDTSVLGTPVPRGTSMLIYLGGANRDPAVFTDPGRFDVTRENASDHVSFSSGVHYCLGAALARLEGTVGLRLLDERFPDLRVVGTPVRRPTRVLRGYEHLRVSV